MTFTIQNAGLNVVGPGGGSLGYGWNGSGVTNSVAVKFDLSNNAGEGLNSTGIFTNAASPMVPAIDLTPSGIDLHSGDVLNVQITYDGSNLAMTITDSVVNKTFTASWPSNFPATVGGNTAFVGFTAGTGGNTAIQDILNWTYSTGQQPAATQAFSLPGGTYLGTQTVTISDSTAGATIFYTLDGTTPATTAGGSTQQYSSAITVSATETITAIAVASGYATSAMASATYTIESQVAAPTFSPGAGTYTATQQVTIATATAGATIYYTTNGTTPTTSSTVYTGPITVSTSETVEAMAAESGFFNSNVSTAVYTITSSAATPVFSLPGGTYLGTQTVAISDSTAGATIFYTLDGTTPATTAGGSTQQYSSAITVSATETIKAIAVASGYATSAMASATYTIESQVAAPTFSPGAGTYTAAQQVTIGTATAGATIYYTTNGTTPTTSSTVYTGPITVSTSETVEAMAAESGFFNSNVSTAVYTITSSAATPVITPGTGTYTSAQTVTITDGTTGASIYYTLDGSQPTTTSTQYTASFKVSTTTTVKAIATATNFTTSATATSVITIQSGMPAINFGSGFTAGGMVLNGKTTLNGARLRLTDGGGSEASSDRKSTRLN